MTDHNHASTEHHQEHSGEQPKVVVTVDHKEHHVYPGPYIVSTFKEIVNVPASDVFEEAIEGHARPLEDVSKVEIRGGEAFTSRLREHKV